MSTNTKVISLKKAELNKLGYEDVEQWINASKDHVYIGRDMTKHVKGAIGSKWGNPFRGDKHGDNWAIKYEEYVRSKPELMASLGELRGKVLGCWCAPEPCHGDVLIKMLNELND